MKNATKTVVRFWVKSEGGYVPLGMASEAQRTELGEEILQCIGRVMPDE